MPITEIPLIARTNTIDEWRIQTNRSATDLNDLGFYVYTKANGQLVIENTASLLITSQGTPLEVANNVLFQNNLTLANNLLLGTQSSAKGNLIAGGTVSVLGPGRSFDVANTARVGVNLEVTNNITTSNISTNNDITIGRNLNVAGVTKLEGSGNVFFANVGTVTVNTMTATTITSANVLTPNLFAQVATIVVLNPLDFATIRTLESTTTNAYYLSSNTIGANVVSIREITANVSGNISNLISNVATINNSTIGNTTIGNSYIANSVIETANVVTLISNVATINNQTVGNSTVTLSTIYTANVVNISSNVAVINTATIETTFIDDASINTSNISYINSDHLIEANTIIVTNVETSTINVETVNVESGIFIQSGGQVRIYSPSIEDEVLTVDGKTTLQTTYVRGNIAIEGTWTALGNVEYEVSEFTLNANTPTNVDATIRNQRPYGLDSLIRWDETDDVWKVSRGNTYTSLYGILDASLLDATVTSNSTSNVATPSAVKGAFQSAQTSGSFANSAYEHSNNAYNRANSNYTNAITKINVSNTTIAYNFDQYGGANPTVFVGAGETIAFELNTNGQPFLIQNTTGENYSTGLTHVSLTGVVTTGVSALSKTSGVLYWKVPFDLAGNTFSYKSDTNAGLTGQIVISPASARVSANAQFARDHANASYAHANTKFASAGGTISGDTTITASLEVQTNTTLGTGVSDRTWIKSKHLYISDNVVTLNSSIGQSSTPSSNVGFEIDRGNQANVYIKWDEVGDSWRFTEGVITNGLLEVPRLGAKSGEEYANAAFTRANDAYTYTATVEATITAPGGFSGRILTLEDNTSASSIYANGAFITANSGAAYANAAFSSANNKLDLSGKFISTGKSALSATLVAGLATVVLTNGTNTTGLYPGMPLRKISGAGEFGQGAAIVSVDSATQITVSVNHVTPGAVVFSTLGGVYTLREPQIVTGDISVTGKLETANIKFAGTPVGGLIDSEMSLNGSKIIFNANHPTNQSPTRNASIEVQRSGTNRAVFRWKEDGGSSKWEYSLDGTTFFNIGGTATIATNLKSPSNHTSSTGKNRLLVQTGLDTTGFTPQAPDAIPGQLFTNKYLQWTGVEFKWVELSFFDGSALNASNLTSGTVPSTRMPTSGTFSFDISGKAGTATTATSATTADTAYSVVRKYNSTTGAFSGSVNTNTLTTHDAVDFQWTGGLNENLAFGVAGRANFSKRVTFGAGLTGVKDDTSKSTISVTGDGYFSGDVRANYFRGTSTRALYGDLAEAYETDEVYPIGTIMMIGGEKEVTAATLKGINAVIGAISDKPAFLMNAELENGAEIALKGRIPLRVLGKCKKGDLLSLSKTPGVATMSKAKAAQLPIRIICLENKDYIEEGLIEVAVM